MVQKPRVYQVAKDFNVSSEALLGILERLGAPAKSHMSTVDPAVVDKVRQMFQEEKEATRAEDARKQEAKAAMEREAKRPAAPAASAPGATGAPPAPAPPEKKAEAPRPAPEPPPAPAPPAAAAAPPRPAPPRRRRGATDEKAVRDSVKKTLANLEGGRPKRYRKRIVETAPQQPSTAVATHEVDEEVIRVPELTSVAELAEFMSVAPAEVITKLLGMGKMATVNQRLDKETIELVALEFGHTVEFVTDFELEEPEEKEEVERPEDLEPRAPVVTVMGHVDHGKTSLLDRVRKANVVAGEKGGITQHIGAYEVRLGDGREVTFLDTPGHEAFTAMRARGAKVTDIVVLVVAADDRVMPQTLEAIDHARAAEVPIIVAINKIDKPEANVPRIKQDLANHNLLIEEFGGTVPAAEISAKAGTGIDELLELILLQADLLELKANPDRAARGVVIESKVEQGRGKVVTVLVQSGTLKVGDPFVCGKEHGRVRAMSDERGKRVKKAGPSMPVEVLGCEGSPLAGDPFTVSNSESQAREVAHKRQLRAREAEQQQRKVSLLGFHDMMEKGEVQELNLIIKADVAGSVEVLRQQLEAVGTEEVKCRVIHAMVGQITESDVLLAEASNAVIIGFGVKTDARAQTAAQRNKVDIRHYNIIYEVVEDVKGALSGLLKPEEVEQIQGRAEVRQIFRVSRVGAIAGCHVSEGTISRTNRARLLRDGETVFEGKIGSLKRFKDDVKEVQQGFECGIGLEGFDGLQEGDVIEAYVIEQRARRI